MRLLCEGLLHQQHGCNMNQLMLRRQQDRQERGMQQLFEEVK